MNNKSLIQIQLESIQAKGQFENELNSILEQYDVQDSVFGIQHGARELSNGYFVATKSYDDLTLAIREMENNQALRIIDNKEFVVGNVYTSISECEDCEHIFNIEFLEDVY